MVEAEGEAAYVRHHRQKIALVLSAMRHFAEQLRADGVRVEYVRLDDPSNSGSLAREVEGAAARLRPGRVVLTEPGEWRLRNDLLELRGVLAASLEIHPDDRFLCSREEFARWAEGRRTLRMETFYRAMRRRTGWLMTGQTPEGGRWNFDARNRRRLPRGHRPPARLRFRPDATTREVMRLVGARFATHFGDLDSFSWAVTRAEATRALRHFVDDCLPWFGDYQDAMQAGEDYLYHSALSPYINLGLLSPREVCEAVLAAWRAGAAPLNAVEGFVRQILGWREYVRGVYWTHMPGYAATNHLGARRSLPTFYWSGDTPMACVRACVEATRRNAYAHHIQRLMVTGNLALLAGIAPREVEEWYLCVYADAYEWVELPNTHGMALYADGGLLASKPYAASGAYIDRMSDYCGRCAFVPSLRAGEKACPFTTLYWNFLVVNEGALRGNPRMTLAYRNLARMGDDARRQVVAAAQAALRRLDGASQTPP